MGRSRIDRAGARASEDLMDESQKVQFEAAVFRRLVGHLQARTDVQNIELMNLAGFCRNCLSKWYQAAAAESGVEMSKAEARELVYGMPYDEWKAKHQVDATPEQLAKFAEGRDA
jgi:hypothetical protein